MARPRAHPVTPPTAVAVVALLSFGFWALLASRAAVPRFFLDELAYMRAGTSLAHGHGLRFRGQAWGYGPLYPIVIGGLVRISSAPERAYELVKLVNAMFFALASFPIYLVARRLLAPKPSAVIVAVAALIPSSMYVSVAMTEALGYLLAWLAMYAIALALERPTVVRQLGVLGATGVAVLERPQFVTLFTGYLLGLALVLILSPVGRATIRRAPVSLWPSLLAIVGGAVWVARLLGRAGNHADTLSYAPLSHGYDPFAVAKWVVYEVGDVGLYLAAIPLVLAPVVAVELTRRARSGSPAHGSFLGLFVGQSVAGIAMVGAFASTRFGLGIVYDRYLFYFVPLWLIAVVYWLGAGMPRPVKPLIVGAVASVGILAAMPYGEIGQANWFNQFEALATKMWWKVGIVAGRVPVITLRSVAVGFALAVVVLVAVLPRRFAWTLVGVIAVVFVVNSTLAWRSAFVAPAAYGLGGGPRSWVDRQLGSAPDAAVITVGGACPSSMIDRAAGLETEFFNVSVDQNLLLGGEGGRAPTALTLDRQGRLSFRSGRSLAFRYLVAPVGVEFNGSRLATGMSSRLALWKLNGAPRVRKARSEGEVLSSVCR